MLFAEAPFRSLYGPTALPGTPIKIRMPMVFSKAYFENSPHAEDGGRIKEDRVQPPFMKLPGLRMCYEGYAVDPSNGRFPFYCYLCAVPAKPGDLDKFTTDLQAELKQKIPTTPDKWEDVQVDTADGKYAAWKKIRTSSEQPFYVSKGDKTEVIRTGAYFELWAREAGDYIVVVAWRIPVLIDNPATAGGPARPATGLESLIKAAGDRPSIATMPKLTAGTLTVEGDAGQPAAAGN